MRINKIFSMENDVTLYLGDCINLLKMIPDEHIDLTITSPPYCIGKAYENPSDDINTFVKQHEKIISDLYRITKPGGSVCWEIGYHTMNSSTIPLDYYIYDIFTRDNNKRQLPLILRNRIIWTYGHGLNSVKRFSGRHEVILWFTKGNDFSFDLDSVRIPQKYPGKKSYKGKNYGKLSGNPLGKNPSDVWDIPNVKAQHIEKTDHPCQYPVAIPQRFIKALVPLNGMVLDPFMGSGTSGVAAVIEGKRFIGAEIMDNYYDIATNRINDAIDGNVKIRDDVPVMEPNLNTAVARMPAEFKKTKENLNEKEQ